MIAAMRSAALLLAALTACRAAPPAAEAVADGGPGAGAQAPQPSAVVTGARGAVELQRRGGAWTRASKGDRIGQDDGLRTPLDAEAELSVDGVKIRLHDRSEIRLANVSANKIRATIRGRVESDVAPGKGSVALQVADGSAQAVSEGGHFFVTADGQDVVVAAASGAVHVESDGKAVELANGQVTHVAAGVPQQPIAALQKVLLAVEWPAPRTNQPTLPVSGRVVAGSRVYVQGEPVQVAPNGEFRAEVKLQEGRQSVAVVTVDPLGRRAAREAEVLRESSPPQVRMAPPWR
jgi:hypothetical protein